MEMKKRLRDLRRSAGLSQAELADRLGLASRDIISSYEIGRAVPSIGVLDRMADLYGVSADYILCKTDTTIVSEEPETPEEQAEREVASRSAEEDFADLFPQASFDTSKLLFQSLRGCTEEELQKAREIIELLRK